jgi:integrase
MARPRRDGAPSSPPRHKKLTELFVKKVRAEGGYASYWDTYQRGLVLRVQPDPSTRRSWKYYYSSHGRPRWLHLGDADAIGLGNARTLAAEAALKVARGKDPAAEKKAARNAGTFAELAEQYVETHAKQRNKSWKQAHWLVGKYLLPRWGKLTAASISRADVRSMMRRIAAPQTANQTLAAASALFSWAIREEFGGVTLNPCTGVARNPTRSRERVLSEAEVPVFWNAFDSAGLVVSTALKTLLMLGQRPGEIAHMRREHIAGDWWELPGEPRPGWPGTKNTETHRVYLPLPVRKLIAELDDDPPATGFVFCGRRGNAVIGLDDAMRIICAKLGIADKVTPHDLRRTHGSTVTAMGFGRSIMNKIQNHKEGGISDVYDRHSYGPEIQRVMAAVADRIVGLAEGADETTNVVRFNNNQQQ